MKYPAGPSHEYSESGVSQAGAKVVQGWFGVGPSLVKVCPAKIAWWLLELRRNKVHVTSLKYPENKRAIPEKSDFPNKNLP